LSFGLILFSLALGTFLLSMLLEVGRAGEVTKLNDAKSMQAEKISVKTYRLMQAAFGSKELTGSFTRKKHQQSNLQRQNSLYEPGIGRHVVKSIRVLMKHEFTMVYTTGSATKT